MFIFFVVAARLFLVFASIHLLCCWSAHKSLAPRTHTLLGVFLHFVDMHTVFLSPGLGVYRQAQWAQTQRLHGRS